MPQESPVHIIDGDTLDLAGERIRLHGIDAPEKDQTCTIDGRTWEWGRGERLDAAEGVPECPIKGNIAPGMGP